MAAGNILRKCLKLNKEKKLIIWILNSLLIQIIFSISYNNVFAVVLLMVFKFSIYYVMF